MTRLGYHYTPFSSKHHRTVSTGSTAPPLTLLLPGKHLHFDEEQFFDELNKPILKSSQKENDVFRLTLDNLERETHGKHFKRVQYKGFQSSQHFKKTLRIKPS